MCGLRNLLVFLFIPACLHAQNAPLVGTTIKATSTSATALCVGCPLGSTTPATNSGGKIDVINVTGHIVFGTPGTGGTMYKDPTLGLIMLGVAGSSNDFSLYTPSGASPILTTPTGTANVRLSGNLGIGGGNLTDSTATPTISSGCGSTPSIAGKDYAFKVTAGTGTFSQCFITFGLAYANAPICVIADAVGDPLVVVSTSTTILAVGTSTGNITASNVINVLCRGY